jgi:hypothetical protein
MSEGTEFITIIRPSFMRFCKDACRAATFNHILFRIAGKCKDQPKEKIQSGEVLWYGSNEQITEEMSNAWGLCKVRKETNELINAGLLGRKSNPTWGVDRTKHFFFGTEQCEKFLGLCEEHNICFVHLDIPAEVKHLIYLSNANDKSIKCICSIHQMQVINLSDAFDKSIEAITKEDYNRKTTIESENTNVNADAINIAPAPSSLSEKKIELVTPPPSTAESEQTTEPQSVDKAPRRKRAPRKSKAKGFEVPAEFVERVNKFYGFLNEWAVKKSGLKQEWFTPDDESNELICSLLASRTVTQKTLEQVCNAMWNEPRNPRTGYYPREHMTVKAIINAFKAKSLMLATNEAKVATTTVTQQYSLAGYTYKPEETKVPEMPFAGPPRLRNKKRGA